MDDGERAALWRRRLFEAEAGMTRLLAAHADQELISAWIRTRSEMFGGLPDEVGGGARDWQAIFFRAQALMERFLVARLGHDALRDWAEENSEVYALVEGGGAPDARAPLARLAKQAELYGSRYALEPTTRPGRRDARDRALRDLGLPPEGGGPRRPADARLAVRVLHQGDLRADPRARLRRRARAARRQPRRPRLPLARDDARQPTDEQES